MKYSKQDVFFFRYYFPMTNSITSKWNLWILFSHVYMMIGVKCRQYYILFSDHHQIMSRSKPESSDVFPYIYCISIISLIIFPYLLTLNQSKSLFTNI